MKEYDLVNPCPDLISSISIRKFRKNQYLLSITLLEKDIELHYSNVNYINLESNDIVHFNTRIDHILLDKINSKNFRRFESREGRYWSCIFIPAIYLMTNDRAKLIKKKAKETDVFQRYIMN